MTEQKFGGWQFWVEVYDDYVIKTPKTKKEVEERVKSFLSKIGRIEELDERVEKVMSDIEASKKIILKSKVPRSLLANLEFLKNNKIKQSRVIILGEALAEANKKDAEKLIEKTVKLFVKLWQYGIHENTLKFNSNVGVLDGRIVLIDPFEITDKKEKVIKLINEKKWRKPFKTNDEILKKYLKYFHKKLDEYFTLENLEKNWKIK